MKEKLIAAGAEKLAEILLSLYESHQDLQKQLDIIFSGLDEDPKKMLSLLKKELSFLKRSTRFVDYHESDALADRLNHLRLRIAVDLVAKSPEHARALILDFLDLHEKTLERVDDSNGTVSDVFREACGDFGKIYAQISTLIEERVDLVFTLFMQNEYGIYDDLIAHFKDALQEDGLYLLGQKFENALDAKNKSTVKQGLQSIADCQKDVDAYIRSCSLSEKPYAHDHLKIAQRLIAHWRGEEALTWLNTMEIPKDHPWQEERLSLKIQALDLCGEYETAQKERLDWFEKNLNADLYQQILKHADAAFKESFQKEAIEKSFCIPQPNTGLKFLMDIQKFEEGAKFVRLKIDQFNGRYYTILRPAADILRNTDPLAATLLYRKLIEPILEDAKSKYYAYAAKDLVTCGVLSSGIETWGHHKNHDEYLHSLEEKHKKKHSFWSTYQLTFQKHTSKGKV